MPSHTPSDPKPTLPVEPHPPAHGAGKHPLVAASGKDEAQVPHPSLATSTINGRRSRNRWLIRGGIGAAILLAVAYFALPAVRRALDTVSTDDAYVNSHVTFVAPRVPGQVTKVFVDDNNRVRQGELLVQLDKEPYQVQRDLKQSAVEVAQADLLATQQQVRAFAAQARSNRFKLQHAIELVDNQVSQLRAAVAAYENQMATLELARADIKRAEKLLPTKAISKEDYDRRVQQSKVGEAQVKQALEQVHQIRVGLGLPADPKSGNLTQVPRDLDQTFSSVRQALADLMQSAAPLGIIPASYDASPRKIIEDFYKLDPEGNVDRIYAKLMEEAPIIKQAQSKLEQAKRDLAQADLNLRYCDVFAEIGGVVTRRNVNPGNNVQAGQALMAIRSLTEIWIDANFKETQLAELRIGQRVDVEVDMYGRRRTFEGRISGFTMGTGSTLALLPAQNATGNFIKVVQRLPVRIELINYDPDQEPLFVGLSVVPYVFIKEPATGPDAGKVLQPTPMATTAAEKPASTTGATP
jgi:membrane fusion protein (multidrug efflux system)